MATGIRAPVNDLNLLKETNSINSPFVLFRFFSNFTQDGIIVNQRINFAKAFLKKVAF